MVGLQFSVVLGGTCSPVQPPAAVSGADFTPDKATLAWSALPVASTYDVVTIDLLQLGATSGDFATSQILCLEDDTPSIQSSGVADPPAGQVLGYLIRGTDCSGQVGTYGTDGTGQVGTRDSGLASGSALCGARELSCGDQADNDGDGVSDCDDGDCLLDPVCLTANIRINEIMASNSATLADEDGAFSDWIELYNPTLAPVDLTGWHLTDDPGNPTLWTFPATTLGAQSYLVVFASDKNRDVAGSELHTNFKLSAGGEFVGLVRADGSTFSSQFAPAYPEQFADISYGIGPAIDTRYFPTPTPGTPNNAGVQGVVADTSFSIKRSFFDVPFQVAITTATNGATIRYTLDGSAPSEVHGSVYSGPLTISGTTVLRAIAYLTGYLPTNVDTQTYIRISDVLQQPATIPGYANSTYSVGTGGQTAQHDYEMDPTIVNDSAYSADIVSGLQAIPTLSIAVDPGDIFGAGNFYDNSDIEKPVSVEVLYPASPLDNHQADAGIESHSHNRLKRSLRLNFRAIYGDAHFSTDLFRNAPVSGGSAADELDVIVLRAGNNRSWARNWNPDKTAYTIDQFYRDSQIALSGYGSHGTFVHLYINGIYWGLYNPIERPDHRFMETYFAGNDDDWFAVHHGGDLSGDDGRYDYLKGTLAGRDMSVPANYAELEQYLDPIAFADYLILSWWTGTGDWPNNNWYGGNRNSSSPLGTTPHRYVAWDGEWSWDAPRGFSNPGNRAHVHPKFHASQNGTNVIDKLWHAARENPEFLVTFADRVHRHVHNAGALTDAAAQTRWLTLTTFIEDAVVAESARWGDALDGLGDPTRTRDVDWQNQVDAIYNLINGNGAVFVAALRAQGFYPDIDAPELSQHGGSVPSGYSLAITNPEGSGVIYYTLDGSDPRQPGGAVSPAALVYTGPLTLNSSAEVMTRLLDAGEWSALTQATFQVF